jgi:hypothetical protein
MKGNPTMRKHNCVNTKGCLCPPQKGKRDCMNTKEYRQLAHIGRGRVIPVIATIGATRGNALRSSHSIDRQLTKILFTFISILIGIRLRVHYTNSD